MTPRLRLSDPLLRVQSDERLAALAGHGGERAFAILVERHRGALLAFARRLGAGAGAEDVVQQTLLQAWSALQRGARVEHVSAWMHQIVRNAAIRAAASSLDSTELPATLVSPSQTADEVELRHETRRLLAEIERLPARQREALVRLAVEGGSGDEVGEAMDLEPNAVRQLAFRARTRLRAAMGACVPWPIALWAARDGVPELVGGAGVASGAGAAGLLKLGAIATTTAVVAVGAGGIAQHAHHPRRPAAATRSHVAAAGAAAPATTARSETPVVASTPPTGSVEHRRGSTHLGDGESPGSAIDAPSSSGSGGKSSDAGGEGRHGVSGDSPSQEREHGGDRTPTTAPTHTEMEHSDSSGSSHGDVTPRTSGDDSGGEGGDQHASGDSGSGSPGSGDGDSTPSSSDDPPGDG